MDEAPSASRRALAWSVHAFTGTGAVLALLAVLEIERGEFRMALVWLLVALVVDGVDGTLARLARTKELAGRVDGDTLDLVVDYLSYVFVPTLFMWHAGLMPEQLALPRAAAIQISSLYLFARKDLKTDDNYFRGFPALWNLVALYLFATAASATLSAVVICVFVAFTFAPVHFVHPARVRDYGPWLPLLALLWAVATAALLYPEWTASLRTAWLAISAATGILLVALGLFRTVRGARPS